MKKIKLSKEYVLFMIKSTIKNNQFLLFASVYEYYLRNIIHHVQEALSLDECYIIQSSKIMRISDIPLYQNSDFYS